MNLLLILILVSLLTIVLLMVFKSRIFEPFNNLESKIALYDHPNECPFDYIRLYEDNLHNNKFVVESKLTNKSKELDHLYDTMEDYNESWDQIKRRFPNITKCGDPYAKYMEGVRTYYENQKYAPTTRQTTVPLYSDEGFTSNTQIDLPSIDADRNIQIHPLVRTVNYSSQMATNQYMTPNTSNLQGNEQIDTSVKSENNLVPITYSDKNVQLFKNQLMDSNFEQQRTYQKQMLQMSAEVDRLRREIEQLREQLVFEKSHFENLDKSIEEKHQKILDANKLNVELSEKINELNKKNKQFEEMYLQADSQKTIMEVRLKALRDSAEEDIKNKGYTILPPTHWTINQWRPPICIASDKNTVCPLLSKNDTGQYATIFDETSVKSFHQPNYQEIDMDPIKFKEVENKFLK